MKKLSSCFAVVVPVLLALASASQSFGMTITFGAGVTDTVQSSIANCNSPYTHQGYTSCTTTGFISDEVATSASSFLSPDTFDGGAGIPDGDNFITAFSHALGGDGWTLTQDMSTVMNGINLKVTNFSTGSYAKVGGIGLGIDGHDISVQVQGTASLSQSLISQLVWIQGLEIDYVPGKATANYDTDVTYNTLDDATFNSLTTGCLAIPAGDPASVPGSPTGKNYCDPIYPFHSSDLSFYDSPQGPWPDGSFRGIALLATIDTVDKEITVYGGVDYGFDNHAVPEPGTWAMLFGGACLALLLRRRFASAA